MSGRRIWIDAMSVKTAKRHGLGRIHRVLSTVPPAEAWWFSSCADWLVGFKILAQWSLLIRWRTIVIPAMMISADFIVCGDNLLSWEMHLAESKRRSFAC